MFNNSTIYQPETTLMHIVLLMARTAIFLKIHLRIIRWLMEFFYLRIVKITETFTSMTQITLLINRSISVTMFVLFFVTSKTTR